jgi:hypothetical protein
VRLLAAHGLDRPVVHQRQQPGGDAPPGAVEAARIAPDRHEDVLQHVLGQDVVGEDAAGQRERRPLEPLVQVDDRTPVSGADPPHEVSVARGLVRTPWRAAHGSHRHTFCSRSAATCDPPGTRFL